MLEIEVNLDDLMPLFRERLQAGQRIKFSPRGVSMLPMLRQGIDTVTLCPAPARLRRFDLPLYQRDDGKYILHRVVDAGETYTCLGDNQFLPEYGVRQDQIIAVVCAFSRDGKAFSVEDWRYRAYCRLWHGSRPLRHLLRRGKTGSGGI